MNSSMNSRRNLLVCAGLALITLAVFWPVCHQEFLNYDDNYFLTTNPYVQKGLTSESIVWAFRDLSHGWWHPLTWLSHMLDWQLFGANPGAQKLVNVTFHIGSTLLLFLVLNRMTTAPWRSAFVAAAFALHPLRVESVAWLSERKDVLSAFFWMLTMWLYVRYVENPQPRRFVLVSLCFALGLMAKSMLVTLPFVLLLLDVWPLRRVSLGQAPEARRSLLRLVKEKLPLFVLSAVACVMTYWAQSSSRVHAVKSVPLLPGVANAVVSYLLYIRKTLWPTDLAVFYPHPGVWALSHVLFAAVVVGGITVLVVRAVRTYPFLTVGWLWFLGTLVPVIGLVQAGDQAIADRYTYVPTVGLLIMAAWGLPELLPPTRRAALSLRVVAVAAVIAMMVGTCHQLRYWRNSITLFERAIAVTSGNYVAHNNLGLALMEKGRVAEAGQHFQLAVELWPEFPEANKNLADILASAGRLDEAVRHYHQALEKRPLWADAENNLGSILGAQGQLREAVTHFSRALQIEPGSATAELNLGLAYMKLKNADLALAHLAQSLALNPTDAPAHYFMGLVLKEQGRQAEAAGHFREALRLNPHYAESRAALKELNQE